MRRSQPAVLLTWVHAPVQWDVQHLSHEELETIFSSWAVVTRWLALAYETLANVIQTKTWKSLYIGLTHLFGRTLKPPCVNWSCHNKVPQTGSLTYEMFTLNFRRLEIWNHRVSRLVPSEVLKGSLFYAWLLAALSHPWLTTASGYMTPVSTSILTGLSSLVSVWPPPFW